MTGNDPFGNVTPESELSILPDVEDTSEGKVEEVVEGNTICRIIYDAPNATQV